jgi:hypothetical protein
VCGLDHHERIDLLGRGERSRVADPGARQQGILIVRFIALFGAQQPPVAEERHQHFRFDPIVGVALVKVDFERAVRHEEHVARQQLLLHARLQDIGEVFQFERFVDATARWIRALAVVLGIGFLATARGDHEISQAIGRGAVRDVEGRVAADRCQRQPVVTVALQQRRKIYDDAKSCA